MIIADKQGVHSARVIFVEVAHLSIRPITDYLYTQFQNGMNNEMS